MSDYPKQLGTSAAQFRLTLALVKDTRIEQRRLLAETWIREEENSRYRYDVEKCRDGRGSRLIQKAAARVVLFQERNV
jgi:hypothetical protein